MGRRRELALLLPSLMDSETQPIDLRLKFGKGGLQSGRMIHRNFDSHADRERMDRLTSRRGPAVVAE